MAKNIRYILKILNPKTKKWYISKTTKTLKGMVKAMSFNLSFNPDYYTDENGKRLEMKLIAQQKIKQKWEELEEYRLTKKWRIYGYIEWDKIGRG